MDHGL